MHTVIIKDRKFQVDDAYQPIYGEQTQQYAARECRDRLSAILSDNQQYGNGSMLRGSIADWGCNLGFFTYSLATRCSGNVYGIEANDRYLAACKYIKETHAAHLTNAVIINGRAPEDVPDNVNCHIILSVLHHIIPGPRLTEAIIQKLLYADVIYIEMAHHREGREWCDKLRPPEPAMDPTTYWLNTITEDLDFLFDVHLVGEFDTSIRTRRPLYAAYRRT